MDISNYCWLASDQRVRRGSSSHCQSSFGLTVPGSEMSTSKSHLSLRSQCTSLFMTTKRRIRNYEMRAQSSLTNTGTTLPGVSNSLARSMSSTDLSSIFGDAGGEGSAACGDRDGARCDNGACGKGDGRGGGDGTRKSL